MTNRSRLTQVHRAKRPCARWHLVFLACSVMAFVSLPGRATGLVIMPRFDDASFIAAGYNATDVQNVHNAFEMAELPFENAFSDSVHVNIMVQAGNTSLGSSSTTIFGPYPYGQVRSALLADYAANPDSTRTTAGATLGADPTNGRNFWIARAELKALGLMPDDSVNDGTFTFSNAQQYTWNNTAAPQKYDFVGVAEHEISEIMGRIQGLGTTSFDGTPGYLPNDLFRYKSAGTRSMNQTGTAVYFSIDGGTTKLMGFNSNASGDLSDYDGSSLTEPFNAFTTTNQAHTFSTVDLTNMDVLGWDVSQTPEPTSLLLFGTGSLVLAGMGLRRKLQLPKIRVDEN